MPILQPPDSPLALNAAPWRLQLLGGLRARHAAIILTHFGGRSMGALLARLALYPPTQNVLEPSARQLQ